MQDTGRMQRLESTQNLVHKVLEMVVGQILRTYNPVKIRFHEFLYEIYVGKLLK